MNRFWIIGCILCSSFVSYFNTFSSSAIAYHPNNSIFGDRIVVRSLPIDTFRSIVDSLNGFCGASQFNKTIADRIQLYCTTQPVSSPLIKYTQPLYNWLDRFFIQQCTSPTSHLQKQKKFIPKKTENPQFIPCNGKDPELAVLHAIFIQLQRWQREAYEWPLENKKRAMDCLLRGPRIDSICKIKHAPALLFNKRK